MTAAKNHIKWACLAVCALLFNLNTGAQSLVEGEYFFDEDPGPGMATELSLTPAELQDFEFSAPVGDLESGSHSLSVRFLDNNGQWGITQTTAFYINGPEQELPPQAPLVSLTRGEYFWGADPGPGNGISLEVPVGEVINLAATVSVPFDADSNILGVRFQDLSGTWGVAQHFTLDLLDSDIGNLLTQDFTFSPSPATPGGNVNFADQSTGLDNDVLIQWDVDGDNNPDYFGSNIQLSFAENGFYPVRQVIVNEPSGLAQSADAQFYFRNSSLADEGGTFTDLISEQPAPTIVGKAGDAFGARSTGPAIYAATASGEAVDAFSVSFWVRGDEYNHILQMGESAGIQFDAFTSATQHSIGGITVQAGNTEDLYDGFWHHIGFRYEEGVAESFLDGEIVQTRPISLGFPFNLDTISIGGISDTNFANGVLDDLSFFTRKLSDGEIQTLANETYASSLIKNVQVGDIPEYEIDISGNTTLCDGEGAILSAPAADEYLWSTGETSQSILAQEAGNYLCQLTIDGDLAITNSVDINVLPRPVVELTTQDASNGESNGSAAVSVSGGNSFVYQYLWSSGSTLPIAQNLSSGNYLINVTDGVCPVNIDFQIFSTTPSESPRIVEGEYFFGPDPGPGQGEPFTIPEGSSVSVYIGIVPPDTLEPGEQPILSFRTKDDQGKWGITQSQKVFIFEDVQPEIDDPEDLVQAEYFFDGVDPGVGLASALPPFTPGTEINFNPDVLAEGLETGPHLLHVRVRDENGKWGIARTEAFSIEFVIPPTLPDELLTIVNAEYFIGDEDPGPGNATALAVPPGTNLDIQRTIDVSNLEEGTYKLNVRTRDITGQWSVTKTSFFDVITLPCDVPSVDFTFNNVNAGETVNFVNASSNTDGQTNYSWDIGADGTVEFNSVNASTSFVNPGLYDIKLIVDNGEDCLASLIKQVEVGPLLDNSISLNGQTEFCEGNSVELTAPNGSSYFWSTLETSQSIQVNSAGSYSCTYIDANGNQAYTNAVEVIVNPSIEVVVDASDASNGDANGSAAVFATDGSTFTYSYLWSDGNETQVNTSLSPGNYDVTVSDGVCPQTESFEIENLTPQGLNLVAGEYFFGEDPGIGNGTPLLIPETGSFDIYTDIATNDLSPGYQFLSIRLKQSDGSWGIAKTIPVNIFDPDPEVVDNSPSEVVAAEYFIGFEDPGPGNAIATNPFSSDQTILATAIIETIAFDLEPGPVKLSTRVKDANGNWSITKSQDFFIQVEPAPNLSDTEWPLVAAEYFIGMNDPGPGLANAISFNQGLQAEINESVDLSGLAPGPKLITIRVKDGNGKWSVAKTIPFEIEPVDCPVPNVSFSNTPANIGGNSTLQNTSSNTLPGATYSWDLDEDGEEDATGQSAQLSVSDPGSYYVTLSVDNGNGCLASDTREIYIGPSFNNLITNTGTLSFCEGGSVILTAPNGSNHLWNNEENTQSITVTEAGTYSVSYSNILGTPSFTSAEVIVYPALDVEPVLNNPTNGNSNGSAGVFVSGGSQFTYSYNWDTGESTALITDKPAGIYTVTISDEHCPEIIPLELIDQAVESDLIAAEYFWNSDPGVGNANPIDIPESNNIAFFAGIETDGLNIGYHTLSLRTQRSSGVWGIAKSIPVYLGDPDPFDPPAPLTDLVEVEYFVDEDTGVGSGGLQGTGPASSISADIDISVDGLSPGAHIISTRAKDENGRWGVSKSSSFEICNPPPTPELVDESAEVCIGGTVTIKVTDLSSEIIWVTPQGGTVVADSLVLNDIQLTSGGIYQVFAQSEPGCFSPNANFELTVLEPPVIENVIEGAPVVCKESDNAIFFIPPVEFATNYEWQFPESGEIVSGNNTNNIAIDFSLLGGDEAEIGLITSNLCGADTASPFIQPFECNDPCSVDGQDGILVDGECLLYDCNNILGGDAYLDDCGVCNSIPFDDNETCAVIVEGAIASLFICTDSEVKFELYQPGTAMLVQSINGFVSTDGTFDFGVIETGNYDVFVKVEGYLNRGVPNVSLQNMSESIEFGTLDAGDFFSDNIINANDFTIFANVFFSTEGELEYDPLYDLNCDGSIDDIDYTLFVSSFFLEGDSAPIQE